jgi:hypothetical protein
VISVNGAEGISDIEGKAVMGSGERAGKRASFKSVVSLPKSICVNRGGGICG